MDDSLRLELEQMLESDQEHRKKMWEVAREHGRDSEPFQDLVAKQRVIDTANLARLLQILEQHGWPGRSLVGEKATNGAFLVLQHAGLADQEKYLPLVRAAADAGELRSQALALLEDRVRMRRGEKQIYGSQMTTNPDGNSEPWPIEDEPRVDRRRAKMGLEPMADYLKRFGLPYVPRRSE